MRLSTLSMDLLCCQEHSQLSNWLGVVRTQAGQSWSTTAACLDGGRPRAVLSETRLSTPDHSERTKDPSSAGRAPPAPQEVCVGQRAGRGTQSEIDPSVSAAWSRGSRLCWNLGQPRQSGASSTLPTGRVEEFCISSAQPFTVVFQVLLYFSQCPDGHFIPLVLEPQD